MLKIFKKEPKKYLYPGCCLYSKQLYDSVSFEGYDPRNFKVLVGSDRLGHPVFLDVKNAPSVLIAGAPGSGKSVCINSILYQLLSYNAPDTLKLYIADPKMIDYDIYKNVPHLADYQTQKDGIKAMIEKINLLMMERYKLLKKYGKRKIDELPPGVKPPRIVLVFDEMACFKTRDILDTLENIARVGRASGVHMILATQTPKTSGADANLTSVLKANCPTKIAFRVDNVYNSRAILDVKGAEYLTGNGDGLIRLPGKDLLRFQGVFISDDEIKTLVDFWKPQPLKADEVKPINDRLLARYHSELNI